MPSAYINSTFSPVNTPGFNRLSNIYQYDYINNQYEISSYQYDNTINHNSNNISTTTPVTPTPINNSTNNNYLYDTNANSNYQYDAITISNYQSNGLPINNYQNQYSNKDSYPSYLPTTNQNYNFTSTNSGSQKQTQVLATPSIANSSIFQFYINKNAFCNNNFKNEIVNVFLKI